ncbi:MAG: relaxase/mobilization nuclease domain-containing protein [Amphiplicatus sp.]
MVPKIHAKGSSFKGAAAYLLHDKGRAGSSERVAWAETRNLATGEPELGWRIMAATAMDQARLKAEAGVKATGRKSDKHVLHISLSWRADEAETLNRDEMMRAANGALRALGADDRQAMIIAHSDEEHPHVHLLVNRVSPTDGKHLSSSKEKLKLSEWALAYEKERGAILCEERALNAEARRRGEYTRGAKEQPRHIFETEMAARAAANDNKTRADQLREKERIKDAALSKRGRAMHARHREDWEALQTAHKERAVDIERCAETDQGKAKAATRGEFRPIWRDLHRKQQDDVRAFEEREARFLGRMQNAADAVSLRLRVIEGTKGEAIRGAFQALASSGARREALRMALESEKRAVGLRQRALEVQRARVVEEGRVEALRANARRFEGERAALILAHAADRAKNRAEWRARTQDRKAAWRQFRQEHLHRPAPQPDREVSDVAQRARAQKMSRPVDVAARQDQDAEVSRRAAVEAAKARIMARLARARDKGRGGEGNER